MENYSYTSADSSPRSREIDFENTPPWDVDPNNYKLVKFMCSYGGKIHPRSHDNQLSYIGGETKIFAVDRSIKFSTMLNKLSALCNDHDIMFKYQLPGEDLDALISVTSDDDLEHMMHEYDRLFRVSPKPARMRLFLFPASQQDGSGGNGHMPSGSHEVKTTAQNNLDFMYGIERGMHAVPPPQIHPQPHQAVPISAKLHEPIPEPGRVGFDNQIIGQEHVELQRELQRMNMGNPEQQGLNRRKSEDNYPGEYYTQKKPEKSFPGSMPVTVPSSGGYWPEKQLSGGFPPSAVTTHGHQEQQPVYVIPGAAPPSTMYQTPQGMRPVTGQTSQGFYPMQRMGGDVYREQQVYNVAQMRPSVGNPVTMPPQQPAKVAGHAEGIGMVQSSGGSGGSNGAGIVGPDATAYAHVGYDNVGRQVYYTAPGGVVAQPPPPRYYGVATTGSDMRNNSQEGKVVATKVRHGPV